MVFSGDLLKKTYFKFKPEINVNLTKVLESTWTSIKYFALKYK